ncbi:hypothetical protein [Arthrobacter ulcerisalmonis]
MTTTTDQGLTEHPSRLAAEIPSPHRGGAGSTGASPAAWPCC